jgi:transposase-like protein
MARNGPSPRSVAEALGISENLLHQWKRAARANQSAAELEVERLRRQLKQVESDQMPQFFISFDEVDQLGV